MSTLPERDNRCRTGQPLRCGRAIVIGCLLIPAGIFFGAYGYLIVQALIWAQTSLQLGSVCSLFLVIALSRSLGRIHGRLRLERHELLIIYIMVSLAACVSGVGFVPFLVNTMAAGHYYATPENRWEDLITTLPTWFGPHDEGICRSGTCLAVTRCVCGLRAVGRSWREGICAPGLSTTTILLETARECHPGSGKGIGHADYDADH